MDANKVLVPIVLVIVIAFVCLACRKLRPTDTEEQEVARGENRSDNTMRQLQSNEASGGWVDRAPSWTVPAGAAAVEMVHPVRTNDESPLVCTYRKEDGWREGSCGVCLADLDDGEAVRVLPACMHYFHAACVGEWLCVHATCPLCRAPLVAPTSASPDATAEANPTRAPLPNGRQEPRPRTLNPRYYGGPAWHQNM